MSIVHNKLKPVEHMTKDNCEILVDWIIYYGLIDEWEGDCENSVCNWKKIGKKEPVYPIDYN